MWHRRFVDLNRYPLRKDNYDDSVAYVDQKIAPLYKDFYDTLRKEALRL